MGQGANTIGEVTVGDKLRVFTSDEEDVAKAFGGQVTRLLDHGSDIEGDAEDGIIARKSAVGAIIDAFIGKVERGEKPDGFTKVTPGDGCRTLR